MLKRTFAMTLLAALLLISLGGQALAAPAGEVVWDSSNNLIWLHLVDEKEAVEIARKTLGKYSLELESARLLLFRSTVAWEVTLMEKDRFGTVKHQIWVNFVNGDVLEHKSSRWDAPRPPVEKPGDIDQREAIRIARGEVAQDVEVRATAHLENSRIWVINMAPKGLRDSTERIYVMINQDSGAIIERGWLKDSKSHVVKISPERAIDLAGRQANFQYRDSEANLALTGNTLVWQVNLSGGGNRNSYSVFVDAFTGRIISQG